MSVHQTILYKISIIKKFGTFKFYLSTSRAVGRGSLFFSIFFCYSFSDKVSLDNNRWKSLYY